MSDKNKYYSTYTGAEIQNRLEKVDKIDDNTTEIDTLKSRVSALEQNSPTPETNLEWNEVE